jgi:hypothetical protein
MDQLCIFNCDDIENKRKLASKKMGLQPLDFQNFWNLALQTFEISTL